ncbi:hypothetical protein M438DRAFT_358068 [Aureobasidium pullulans EXF-150]|uniref:C2H2-type domain-containing protein n=1 Tax=Aureobasidium pullulans EXF-150 TaxID=1043002 RepID=A0A074Y344_AURPU|nr:uncharacterized protein M438DRAFT_358068 [Aureobasidium pullulans EXF-150]KEQ81351.1 hypothetical protein M438DRAFT_358068 [Aureobasidium pullulans EXF-150]
MTSKKRKNSPAKGPTTNKPKGINENMALQPITPEPTNDPGSHAGYFSGMSPRMAIEVAQICHWGACRQTYTGVDGAADLVNHISEDHVGHDDGYNPRCDFGSCGWTRKGRRDLLMAHVVRHIHDYKPLKCDQCDYSTKEARELVRHKKRRDHQ